MDSVISAAIEEICAEGANGISLTRLWPLLQNSLSGNGLHLCSGVKQAIWSGLLNAPGLHFKSPTSSLSSRDPSIQSVDEGEKLGLHIAAADHLRDNFLGLYDLKAADAEFSEMQRFVLDRLAKARTNGITQSDLAKELNLKGNKIFYIVKSLECRQLIVRQSTIIRTKEGGIEGENGTQNTSIVNTNLIHLYRFAKQKKLASQQRLEITKPDIAETSCSANQNNLTGICISEEFSKEDMSVKDYLPAMKAVCDKLEEASDKVLVVSDIKQALGYRRSPGHKAWRTICNRLKDSGLVEEFRAEVSKKVVTCLRLLKKFDPQKFQSKSPMRSHDFPDNDQLVECRKGGQISDELVEIPIDSQVYDMIDAAGSKGITVNEVRKRLGIDNKRSYNRLALMFSRFGLHLQPESHNRSALYRVWTPRNFNHSSTMFHHSEFPDGNNVSTKGTGDLILHQQISDCKDEFTSPDKSDVKGLQIDLECQSKCPKNKELIVYSTDQLHLGKEIVCMNDDVISDLVNVVETDAVPHEYTVPISFIPTKLQTPQRFPSLTYTTASIQREQRVLERLQAEKVILTAELYRWLETIEKDKNTTMGRKTLTRMLKRLQQEGQCRCVSISVPYLSNCGRTRTTEVVLHPSIESLPPELLAQIHERLRIFDMQSRGQGSTRSKDDGSIPVLTSVKRTSNQRSVDSQSAKAEAMRANGYVPAKMVRAKLLHSFFWGYISKLPDWCDALSSGIHCNDPKNPDSLCKLFAPDVALKEMPLELFLQVLGSTQKFENIVESCRRGLCLSDLPLDEYKCFMSQNASERLSKIIGILCRLKLIRLVTQDHVGATDSCAALMYAMELKPYIEEPLSRSLPSSSVNSSDLRPRVRHDFILSNREAVDAYWKTLEYCYAAADPMVASQAFPGSTVPEVFYNRSWASTRVMTTEQRIELLKRISNDNPDKKIAFHDCVKIARDLSLTLEQVLRIYYDKRRSHIRRRDSVTTNQEHHHVTKDHGSISRKRKSCSDYISIKHGKNDTETIKISGSVSMTPSITSLTNVEEQNCGSSFVGDGNIELQEYDGDTNVNNFEESRVNEDGDDYSFISHCAFSRLRPLRRRRFSWTEESDRQLVIQYARHRAVLGPRYNRADWASLPDLPAPPDTCRRRMAILNSNLHVRRAVMKLCNLLSEQYLKHVENNKQKELVNSGDTGPGKTSGSDFREPCWDDFEEKTVAVLLHEVLQCRQMAKLEISKRVGPRFGKEWSDLPHLSRKNLELHASEVERLHEDSATVSSVRRKRSRRQSIPQKFVQFLSDKDLSFSKKVCESLSITNAVELLKVVFLSTSAAPEVQSLLEATLRRYSDQDLFAAFSYLREKKFMVTGHGSRPFVFSRKFWESASSSPIPANTGKRASNFAHWLQKRDRDLMEDETNLNANLECGDIFHLFALVSSGEFSISPCLPNEGVGEADEQGLKRKGCKEKSYSDKQVKKQKTSWKTDSEFCSRREKGFPGIKVLVRHSTYSRAKAVELNKEQHANSCLYDNTCQTASCSDLPCIAPSLPNNLSPSHKVDIGVPVAISSSESLWEAISCYAKLSMPTVGCKQEVLFTPKLFKALHISIHEAGEQGLNIEEVSQVMDEQGQELAEVTVHVLQIFGLVLKVNAYNCVRVIDASYRPKYFFCSISGHHGIMSAFCHKSRMINSESSQQNPKDAFALQQETTINLSDGHKVTLLDLPEAAKLESEAQCRQESISFGDHMQGNDFSLKRGENEPCTTTNDLPTFWPILPWMNADGSINAIMYKGLTRRILGTVMQNPGILEVDLIRRMSVLNPQSCRKLLELLVLENHLIVREMHQTTAATPPAILGSLFGNKHRSSVSKFCKHYFANPMSTSLL